MKKKKEEFSTYEENLLWMSCRYCIGKHTIASVQHAEDIAKYSFDRIPEDRKQLLAKDIRMEIANVLRGSNLNFNISYGIEGNDFRPLELFLEFIINNEVHSREEIGRIASVEVSRNPDTGIIKCDVSNKVFDFMSCQFIDTSFISDLLPWMDLANALDSTSHKFAEVKNEDGTVESVEYFDSYYENYSSGITWNFERIKRPLKEYLEEPFKYTILG